MWELDYKESWTPNNWCFCTVVLEKTLESPLGCKEIQPVHSKGNQSWVFIGRTDVEAETPIFWPRDAKSWLIWKDPDAGKDWRWKEKGTTEDEMVGWHYQLNGHEFEQAPEVGDGQGGLACCSSWGRKESDTTERPNWTELNWWERIMGASTLRVNGNQHAVHWYTVSNFINTEIRMAEFIDSRCLCVLTKHCPTQFRMGLHDAETRPLIQNATYF